MRSVIALTHRPRFFLALAIAIFTAAVSAVGFWKYAHYRYQGLDLAIYTNVLYGISHGNDWYSSIQGGSYLGDHVEPILLALAPLFRLWPDARLLIILQALALGLTAIPVYFLLTTRGESKSEDRDTKQIQNSNFKTSGLFRISDFGFRISWPAVLAGLWLLNPLLWNAALFEFHALAFAPVFVLLAAYCFLRWRFRWFLVFTVASVLVREDVALIIAMFGIIAAIERRRWYWAVAPLLVGIGWFVVAMEITAANSASGAYKFLVYYGWLRDAPGDPFALLRHFLSLGNIDMALGLLLPFLFLPLFRPRWLLLAVPPLLQIILAAPGGSNVVVETHYALLFLPALTMASIDAITSWQRSSNRSNQTTAVFGFDRRGRPAGRWFAERFPLPRPFSIMLGVASVLAAAWALGPFPGIVRIAAFGASSEDRARRSAYDILLARVPPDAPVAAGYAALPHVAARPSAYALAYAYLGVTQYGLAPYIIPMTTRGERPFYSHRTKKGFPEELRYLVVDQRDALAYAVQFPTTGWSAPYAAEGPTRLRRIITDSRFVVVAERNGVALLARQYFAAQNLDGLERDATDAPLSERYMQAVAPPSARLVVDDLRDVTVSSQ